MAPVNNYNLPDELLPDEAVAALTAASRHALASGCAVVLVENGNLVRKVGTQTTVLKQMPERQTTTTRIKHSRS